MNRYLKECISVCLSDAYSSFEIIVILNEKTSETFRKTKIYVTDISGPAKKRDFGVKKTKGEILSFIDDDAYPSYDRLTRIIDRFADQNIVAVVGPGVTPPDVSWREEVAGWAVASPFGSGSLIYRFLPGKLKYVDDFPTMNLSVRKKEFLSVGGFDSNFYPGEDTKLSHDLVYKIHKRIIYDPDILIYHHRRPLWMVHLKQYGNYGIHRGYFARIFPKTSARIIYFLPCILPIVCLCYVASRVFLTVFINSLFFKVMNYITVIAIIFYVVLLLLNAVWTFFRSRKIVIGMLSIPAVFLTHLWYGLRFIQGFLFFRKPVSEEFEE